MSSTRVAGLVVGIVATLSLVVGCGSSTTDPGRSEARSPAASSEPSGPSGPSGSDVSGGVSVVDSRGETVTFDEVPERVVVTSYRHVLDELLLLDAPPVGFGADQAEDLPPWTQEALDASGAEVERVPSTGGTLNYEVLAALQPDVIVASAWEEEAFATLEGIAPLVVTGTQGFDLEGERLRMLGDLVGQPEQADQVADDAAAGFEDVMDTEEEVALVFGFDDGAPKLAVEWGDVPGREGELLTELGVDVKSDWPFEKNEFGYAEVSEENFGLLDEADLAINIGPYPGNWDADKAALEGSDVLTGTRLYEDGDFHFLTPAESQSLVQWTPLATPTLVETLNRVLQS